jgi:ABC-type sugar transport system permease subunit
MYLKARRKLIIPFLLPAFLVYTVLELIPLILTVSYSFTNWQGMSLNKPFYGIKNYILIFMDPQIWGAMKNTAIFAVAGAIIIFIPAVFISWALTQKIKLKGLFRYVIIAPVVLSTVVTSLLWKLLYNPIFGPINALLNLIGLGFLAVPWLGDSRTALIAIVIAAAWQELGMWIILISAGIERIPAELLEAARIDGANEWQVFWLITMPLVWSVLRLLIILWIILSLQVFSQVWVMVPHGAGGITEVIATLMYTRAFSSRQWGLASAMATLLLVLIFTASLITNRLTRQQEKIEF